MTDTPDILKKILDKKQEEIAKRKLRMSVTDLSDIISGTESPRGFAKALQDKVANKHVAIIAEIKKASPSKGVIRENFKPVEIAQDYAMNGAACLSVLTDKTFFHGGEANLQMARESCPLPVLRKDFIIDSYQIYESRALGSDCILLIVAALSDVQMHELAAVTTELGMDILIEVHDSMEMERALNIATPLIGINNRNLRTFDTSLQTTLDLKSLVSDKRLIITESGIRTQEDVQLMLDNEVYTFLVGEAFMRAERPGLKMRELFKL